MSITDWLEPLSKAGLGLFSLNTIRSLGPFVLSQSERGREALERFHRGQAENEALKFLIKTETESRAAVHKTLLERCIDASPEEQINLQQKIEFVEGTIRQLNVAAKSLTYSKQAEQPSKPEEPKKPIEESWVDRFNHLARMRNEPWRSELLARAFAREAAAPGAVSSRVLWLIGNVEEQVFSAFMEILDLCSYMGSKKGLIGNLG